MMITKKWFSKGLSFVELGSKHKLSITLCASFGFPDLSNTQHKNGCKISQIAGSPPGVHEGPKRQLHPFPHTELAERGGVAAAPLQITVLVAPDVIHVDAARNTVGCSHNVAIGWTGIQTR
jgi:hypothetical protein